MPKIPGTFIRQRARLWTGRVPGTHEPGFVEQPILEQDVTVAVAKSVHGPMAGMLPLHVFKMGECSIILGREPISHNSRPLWHLTISCIDRHPSWDEIKVARYRLLGPDLPTAMFLPPVAYYVNVPQQDHVFHVWELAEADPIWESL